MSSSREEDRDFAFLSLIMANDKDQDNVAMEKCVCSISKIDMFPNDNVSDFHRYRGEVAIDTGFKNMGISMQERENLIKKWSDELGSGVSDWLSQDRWFMYIYYKFMAWRIMQTKSLNPTREI